MRGKQARFDEQHRKPMADSDCKLAGAEKEQDGPDRQTPVSDAAVGDPIGQRGGDHGRQYQDGAEINCQGETPAESADGFAQVEADAGFLFEDGPPFADEVKPNVIGDLGVVLSVRTICSRGVFRSLLNGLGGDGFFCPGAMAGDFLDAVAVAVAGGEIHGAHKHSRDRFAKCVRRR